MINLTELLDRAKKKALEKPDAKDGYAPKSTDELRFKKKHVVQKTDDRNGNKDDVFNATNVKSVDRAPKHGYNPGEDEQVYEGYEVNEDSHASHFRFLRHLQKAGVSAPSKADAMDMIAKHGDPDRAGQAYVKRIKMIKAAANKVQKEETELDEDLKQQGLWKLITDHEKQAKKTKNIIKQNHHLAMANRYRGQLKTNVDDSPKVQKEEAELDEGRKKILASNKPVNPKDLHVSLKDVRSKKPRGYKQYDPRSDFPGVKVFENSHEPEGEQIDERNKLNKMLKNLYARKVGATKMQNHGSPELNRIAALKKGRELMKNSHEPEGEELDEAKRKKSPTEKLFNRLKNYGVKDPSAKPLVGNQTKLDKNNNGKLDAEDFKMLRKEEVQVDEVLKPSMGAAAYISDFVHSKNPKFAGKSKKERMKQALAAYYSAKRGD